MPAPRRFWFLALSAGVVFLAGAFVLLDWGRLFPLPDFRRPEVGNVRAGLKLGAVYLIAALTWQAGRAVWRRPDHRWLGWAFGAILLADTCLTSRQWLTGLVSDSVSLALFAGAVGLFGVAQGLLLARHLTGWHPARLHPHRVGLALLALALLGGITWFGAHYVWPLAGLGAVRWLLSAYLFLLGASVWAAWAARYLGHLPPANARFAALGLTAFLACDLTVVAGISLSGTTALVVGSLTWLFYTPALYLLMLSGYRWPLFSHAPSA